MLAGEGGGAGILSARHAVQRIGGWPGRTGSGSGAAQSQQGGLWTKVGLSGGATSRCICARRHVAATFQGWPRRTGSDVGGRTAHICAATGRPRAGVKTSDLPIG